jgi:trehalose 6-phosphate phosphatase
MMWRDVTEVRRLFEEVTPARTLLVSDFDGTLAPIMPRPEQVRALPEALGALERLTPTLGRVVILSGRATSALRDFLPVPGVTLRGDYGLGEATADERAALDRFASEMLAVLGHLPGTWLERKPGSASVHFRDAPAAAETLEDRVGDVAGSQGLQARLGRLVVEVMPERANKATALQEEIGKLAPEAVLYAGDDTGDQPCFELVRGLEAVHVAVGVRSAETDPDVFAFCDVVVDGPAGWARCLSELADWSEAPDRAGRGAGG